MIDISTAGKPSPLGHRCLLACVADKVRMENGQDLLDLVTHSRVIDTDEEDIDYSAFRVFVLRAGGRVVSVATLRSVHRLTGWARCLWPVQ